MKYKTIIVEDELLNRDFIRNLLSEFCPEIELIGAARDAEEAIMMIRTHHPQIVLMDVELQTATGFDVLEQLKDLHFEVIFITASDHHAFKAIELSATGYLLKPVHFEDLQRAIDKAIAGIQSKLKKTTGS